MRIAHIIPGFNIGGTQRVVLDLIKNRLFQDIDNIVIAASSNNSETLKSKFINVSQKIYQTEFYSNIPYFKPYRLYSIANRLYRRFKSKRCAFKLLLQLKKNYIDILHIHIPSYFPLYHLLYYANKFDIPCVITFHREINRSISDWKKLLSFIKFYIINPVVFTQVSKPINSNFLNIAHFMNIPVNIIPNGVDTLKFNRCFVKTTINKHISKLMDTSNLIILNIGRLKRVKGQDLLIHAIKKMENKDKISLIIVGDGNERQNIEELIDNLCLSDKVFLLGERNNISEIMNKCDLYVSSSRSEGFGLSLVEAMAAGLPVITTDVGPCSSIVQNGYSGIVVPSENPDAIANAIDNFIQTPYMLEIYSKRSSKRAIDFDINKMVSRYFEIYYDILKKV